MDPPRWSFRPFPAGGWRPGGGGHLQRRGGEDGHGHTEGVGEDLRNRPQRLAGLGCWHEVFEVLIGW
jgi:hypothetical protein